MPSPTTTANNEANHDIEPAQPIENDSGSIQLVNTHSDPSQPVNADSTLPTHHVPSHDAHSTDNSNNRNNLNRIARAATFPPRQHDQTWYDYVVTNFKVLTIIFAIITLAFTIIGVIAAIVIPIVLK
ncbi:hypothetical protein B0T12DRAFT_393629 [Alternaria alternata]|jgi:hypothetical protein|nr:hypothetical protein B0T12DRAFT_393629 [Alternaria alternata]